MVQNSGHTDRALRKTARITVILCTYNRCQSLMNALESVARSQLPQSIEWEVLVVDNNSGDRTRAVVEDFCLRYPSRFSYLFEPQPGKSHALNTAIQKARGEVLAFVDDDVMVEPTWLWNLCANVLDSKYVGSGGRILPEKGFVPPRWVSVKERYGLAPLAVFDLGPNAGQLHEPPFGTNMAFRKQAFEKYGDFRTDLGPRPGSEIRNEDTEFGRRLVAAGEPLYYEPSAVVYHSVPQHRICKQYFLTWWFDKARADVREHGIPSDSKWFIVGIPLYLFRRLVIWTLRWMAAFEPARRFLCRVKTWAVAGSILESYCQSRDSKRRSKAPCSGARVRSAGQ